MKKFLLDNYNINVEKIYKSENEIYFFVNNIKIFIRIIDKNEKLLMEIVKVSNILYNEGIMNDTFIINNNGQFFTKKNDKKIVLIRCNEPIQDLEINYFNKMKKINTLELYDVKYEWVNKIERIETFLQEINKEYLKIQLSADYYIGMAENALQLLKIMNNNAIILNIDISKFKKEYKNPLNYKKGNNILNIAKYLKYKLYYGNFNYEELEQITNKLNSEELYNLYILLLFPDYYFEELIRVIDENYYFYSNIIKIIDKLKLNKKMLNYIENKINNKKKEKIIWWI